MHSFDESDPVDLNEADLEVLLGAEGRVVEGGAVLGSAVAQARVDEQAVALAEKQISAFFLQGRKICTPDKD